MTIISSRGVLEKELQAKGLIPPNCRLLEIVISPTAALVLRYEVLVTPAEFVKLSAAFQATAESLEP